MTPPAVPASCELANGGTLFLDEVGELSPANQAKLLRVLQESKVRRVGETTTRVVDIRVISATSCLVGRSSCRVDETGVAERGWSLQRD